MLHLKIKDPDEVGSFDVVFDEAGDAAALLGPGVTVRGIRHHQLYHRRSKALQQHTPI